MKYILLTGAGFSRNWGGWLASEAFEYLLGCPEISQNQYLRDLLWKHQPAGGFENALAVVQSDFKRNPQTHTNNLQHILSAVRQMFADMNEGYFDHTNFEFQNAREREVGTFLARFDAIFTLNQDVLLEHYYIDCDTPVLSGRWDGSELPGMTPIHNAENQHSWAHRKWRPSSATAFQLNPHMQPYFKLHGSSNWEEMLGQEPMLIIGGNKSFEIGFYPVLNRYHELFEEYLMQADTRLMVIGYGFRDQHINQVLMRAISGSYLKIFTIAPEGASLAMSINPTDQAAVRAPSDLEKMFERGLIGSSRRSLREIFGSDSIEFNKVMRFFE